MKPVILIVEDEPAIADTIVYALRPRASPPPRRHRPRGAGRAARPCSPWSSWTSACPTSTVSTCAARSVRPRSPGHLPDRPRGGNRPHRRAGDRRRRLRGQTLQPAGAVRPGQGRAAPRPARGPRRPPIRPALPRPPLRRRRDALRDPLPRPPLDLSRYEYRLLLTGAAPRLGLLAASSSWTWLGRPRAQPGPDRRHPHQDIRAKLRAVQPEIDPIVTHRGLGYSLREDW